MSECPGESRPVTCRPRPATSHPGPAEKMAVPYPDSRRLGSSYLFTSRPILPRQERRRTSSARGYSYHTSPNAHAHPAARRAVSPIQRWYRTTERPCPSVTHGHVPSRPTTATPEHRPVPGHVSPRSPVLTLVPQLKRPDPSDHCNNGVVGSRALRHTVLAFAASVQQTCHLFVHFVLIIMSNLRCIGGC